MLKAAAAFHEANKIKEEKKVDLKFAALSASSSEIFSITYGEKPQ